MIRDDLKLLHSDNSSICLPKQEPIDENNSENKHPDVGQVTFAEQRLFGLNSSNQFHSSFNVNSLSQIANNNVNPMRLSDSYDYLRIKMSPDSHNNQQNSQQSLSLDNSLNALRNGLQFSLDNNQLDPMNSLDGQGGSVVRTRRRKAGINDEDRVCVVCGEPASGYNFDRLTCESCKAFFRRNALKPRDKIKKCNRHGTCNIEGSQRKHCPSCRLEKCLAAGMKKELILPPEKLEQRAKPRRRKNQSVNDDGSVSSPGGMGGSTSGNGTICLENGSNNGYIGNGSSSGRFSPLQMNSPYNNNNSGNMSHLMSQTNNFTLAVAAVAAMNQQRMTNSGNNSNPVMELSDISKAQHVPFTTSSPAPGNTNSNLSMSQGDFFNQNHLHHHPQHHQIPQNHHGHQQQQPPLHHHHPHQQTPQQQQHGQRNYNLTSSLPVSSGNSSIVSMNAKSLKEHLNQSPTSILHNSSRYMPFRPGFAPIPSNGSQDHDYSKEFQPLDSKIISGLTKKYPCLKNFIMVEQKEEEDGVAEKSQNTERTDQKENSQNSENDQIMCRHFACRRWNLRRARLSKLNSNETTLFKIRDHPKLPPDSRLFNALSECVQRIREPFTPAEHLETKVAETLEQEYNRMDSCIRRIIKVVKLLPFFNDIGRPAQLGLLRANIYGLIVLYSSFFFERNIRKLRYPVLQHDGNLGFVTVPMMDDVSGKNNDDHCTNNMDSDYNVKGKSSIPLTKINSNSPSINKTTNLRADFELYKSNTLSAFDLFDKLTGSDDTLRVVLLAVKLFSDDTLPSEYREAVSQARRSYLLFLWTYLRWNNSGPIYLINQRFACLLLSFVDLRTLESRMTDFAKLLSLDGLSPLMREVCSQKIMTGNHRSTSQHHHHHQNNHHHPGRVGSNTQPPPTTNTPMIKQEAADSSIMH